MSIAFMCCVSAKNLKRNSFFLNLTLAFAYLATVGQNQNIANSVTAVQEALKVWTEDNYPKEHAEALFLIQGVTKARSQS